MLTSRINSSEWIRKEQKNINEPPDPRFAIEELRELVKGDSCLNSRMDDVFMLKFLRVRKYNVNNAFKLIQSYYEARYKNPKLFYLAGPSKYKAFLETEAVFMLPNRDEHGCEIYVFRMQKLVPTITIEDVFKMNLMILEVVSENRETQIAGMVVIADFTGFEWRKHYQYLSLFYARKSAEVIQENFPLRFRGFHFINEPFYLYTVYSIIKPFLKDKIRRRVHFHGNNFSSLHKHFSPSILPKYFEGNLEFDPIIWVKQLLEKEEYFKEIGQYGYKR